MNQLRAMLFVITTLVGIYIFLRGWGYTSYQAEMRMSKAYAMKKKKRDFKPSKKLRDKRKIFLGLSLVGIAIVIISFNVS